jgi:hypothetical protein
VSEGGDRQAGRQQIRIDVDQGRDICVTIRLFVFLLEPYFPHQDVPERRWREE